MKCEKCKDTQYLSKEEHLDGSFTFAVCPCTGITPEGIQKLVDTLGPGGEASVELPQIH